jgi:hypothetical protein
MITSARTAAPRWTVKPQAIKEGQAMSLDHLKSLITDGTPVYYIQYDHIFISSIAELRATRRDTYITLDDGVMINIKQFGTSAFWSIDEAKVALAGEVATGEEK